MNEPTGFRFTCIWATLLFASTGPAPSAELFDVYTDQVVLHNKKTMVCDVIKESDQWLEVRLVNGSVLVIPRSQVLSIKREMDSQNYGALKSLRRAANTRSMEHVCRTLLGLDHSQLTPNEVPLFLRVEEKAFEHCKPEDSEDAMFLLECVIRRHPHLHRARLAMVRLLEENGQGEQALMALADLMCAFPNEEYSLRAKEFVKKALGLVSEGKAALPAKARTSPTKMLLLAAAVRPTLSGTDIPVEDWREKWGPVLRDMLSAPSPEYPAHPTVTGTFLAAAGLYLASNAFPDHTARPTLLKAALADLSSTDLIDETYRVILTASPRDFSVVGRYGVFLLSRSLRECVGRKDGRKAVLILERLRSLATQVDWASVSEFKTPMVSIQTVHSAAHSLQFMAQPEPRRLEESVALLCGSTDSSLRPALLWAADVLISFNPASAQARRILTDFFQEEIGNIRRDLVARRSRPVELMGRLARLEEYIPNYLREEAPSKQLTALSSRLRREQKAIERYEADRARLEQLTSEMDRLDTLPTASLEALLGNLRA